MSRAIVPKEPELARETEQLEPEHVQWMLERGLAYKDKQATRMSKAGLAWLREIEVWVSAMLEGIRQHSGG